MKTSPFKVMTTAALATAIAVPASVATADAAEVELQQIAFELDGEVQVVDFEDYIDAIVSESGDLYDYVTEASPEAIGIGEGEFVSYQALVNAIIDADEDMSGKEVLSQVADDEEALVSEDTVAEYGQWGEDEVVAPVVAGVETTNLKQLHVQLEGNYNAEAALDPANYSLTNGDDSYDVADVTMDGDTAVLTLEEAVPNQVELDITVDADLTGEEASFDSVKFFDTTIPEVEGVDVAGRNVVKVSFSEPMNFGEVDEDGYVEDSDIRKAFQLNDGDVFVKDVEPLKNNTEANVYFYSNLDEGENTITVGNEVKDYAGFVTVKEPIEFDVVEDEEAPELLEVKNVTPLRATLVFNEDIDPSTVQAADFYHTSTSLEADSKVKVDGNEVTLEWDEDDALPNGTAYIYVKAESIKDLWGNENDQQLRATAEVELDEEAPELASVQAASESQLVVTFSEEVKSASATDEDNYELVDEDGKEVEIDSVTAYDEDKNQYLVTLEGEGTTGGVTLTVDGVEDIYGNATDDITESLVIGDSTKPVISNFDATLYDPEDEVQTLVVNYKDKMATSGDGSVLDLSKYEVYMNGLGDNDNEVVNLSDLDGINISAIDGGKRAQIELDTEEAGYAFAADVTIGEDAIQEVTMGQVEDAAGNKSTTFSGSFDIESDGEVGILGTDYVNAVSQNKVQIYLNDYVTEVNEDEFDIMAGEYELTITGKDLDNSGSYGSVITFTVDETIETDGTYGDESLTVETNSVDDTTNDFGEPVNISTGVNDGISPVLDSSLENSDGDYEVRVPAADNGIDEVTLTFTEELYGNEDALGTYLTVDGYEFVTSTPSEEGEYTVATDLYDEETGTTTVTLEVYGEDNDDYTIDLEPNRFLTDDEGNKATFQESVTVDVYTSN